jgi:antitoxin CcdA
MADIGQIPAPMRRATNVTLPVSLVAQAKELGINVSQACEAGLLAEVALQRRKRWLEENRAAMDQYNEYAEKNGVPLAEYRMF